MSITRSSSFSRVGFFVFILILLNAWPASATDFNNPLGNLKSSSFKNGVLTATTTHGNFKVTVYSSSVLRIQITERASFNDFSYAVTGVPAVVASHLKEEKDRYVLSTDSVDLIISKNPVRFTLVNKKGEIISADDASFGTSWLGEEVTTYKKLQEGERFIGLGEKTGNLDRKGQAYTNWNTDNFGYPANADALYVTTPFYIGIHHRIMYGIFMDNSSKSVFNFGAGNNRFSSFSAQEGDMNYYLISGASIPSIIESYTSLTGRIEMPPLWSLGLQQSRYSYYPDAEVLSIARTFREKSIPADVIYLDIHYMDRFKIFSWDKQRFPDPKKMTDSLKRMGFHLAVILDPGIKTEKDYAPYDDGIKKDVFVKYPDHTNYTAEVWPGWCNFPDFTKPAVRTWWGEQFKSYVDIGVEGFWNDMNEPATWGQTTPNLVEFDFDGHKATHRTARNVYGLNMVRSTYEGTKKLLSGKRPFLLTRSGYSGIQRYSAVWTGDNVASDDHMMLGVRLMSSMGLAGIPFTGTDVGGFTGNGSDRLFARWVSIGAFSPFFRIHANANTREQEAWSFGEYTEDVAKRYINLRYRLIPYLYSSFHESSETGMPIIRSLAVNYPFEPQVYNFQYQQQFLFGASIMIAPGESTKDFYRVLLPKNDWYNFYDDQYYSSREEIIADAALDHLPVFIKGSSIIPMQSVVQHLTQAPAEWLEVHIYKGTEANRFEYYEDDGLTYDYQKGKFHKRRLSYVPDEKKIEIEKSAGAMRSKFKTLRVVFHGFGGDLNSITINEKAFTSEKKTISMMETIGHVDVSTLETEFSPEKITIRW